MKACVSRHSVSSPPYRLRRWLPGLTLALFSVGIIAAPQSDPAAFQADIVQSTARQPVLPPELQGEGKWEAFRALWRELGALPPTRPGVSPPDGRNFIDVSDAIFRGTAPTLSGFKQRAYYQSLDATRAVQMRRSLATIFGPRVTSPQAQLLLRLTQLRIQQLSAAHYLTADYVWVDEPGAMMCRAMPPACSSFRLSPVPPSLYLVAAIDRIEFRAKTLLALRKKGTIGEVAFSKALTLLQQDARLALTLDRLSPVDQADLSGFGLQPSAPLLFERADFGQEKNLDLRRPEDWANAVRAAGARPESVGRRIFLTPVKESARQQAQSLLSNLDELRHELDQLDPLLAALER